MSADLVLSISTKRAIDYIDLPILQIMETRSLSGMGLKEEASYFITLITVGAV